MDESGWPYHRLRREASGFYSRDDAIFAKGLQEIGDLEVGVGAFATAKGHGYAEDHVFAHIDGDAAAEALVQAGEIQIALAKSDFAGVVGHEKAEVSAGRSDPAVGAQLAFLAELRLGG